MEIKFNLAPILTTQKNQLHMGCRTMKSKILTHPEDKLVRYLHHFGVGMIL